jgi:hypothetical protein
MQKYTFVFHVVVFMYLYKYTSRCMQFSNHYFFVLPLLRKSEYIESLTVIKVITYFANIDQRRELD